MKILVADDNEINRKVAQAFLKALGVPGDAVMTARNGLEAVELSLASAFDLIFMDIQMPVKDGAEAAGEILEAAPTQPVIVALSANVNAENTEQFLKLGMKMVIPKPVTKEAFREALKLIDFSAD